MSGTVATPPYAAFSGAPLSDQEKEDVREFCGYPLYGNGTVIFPAPWVNRYWLALETRMDTAQPGEYQNIRYKLSVLYPLDQAISQASATLNVATAAVFTRNPQELKERTRLFNYYRLRLCQFMGVPAGPNLDASNGGSIQMVV